MARDVASGGDGRAVHERAGTSSSITGLNLWVAITLAASVAATIIDAILLQYRKAYFTGGFLADDYITSAPQAIAFVVGSLLVDAGVIGLVAIVVLGMCGRFGTRRNLSLGSAFVLGLGPLLIANVIAYELMTYLGDTFDLNLLFDLAGRSPREIIAVSSAHLGRFGWLAAGAAVIAVGGLWIVARHAGSRGPVMPPLQALRSLVIPVAVSLVAIVTVTAMRRNSEVLDNGFRRKPTARLLGVVANALTDFDRDGYAVLGRPPDPDLFDSRIRPYALDVPGDGVDEDGVGGDLPADTPRYAEVPVRTLPWASNRDVVLIVLESVRADAVGARVDGRPVTPVLDALAARGISSGRAYSHNGYTVQSRHHIFSGSTAGVRGETTLVDDFKAHGYQTAYFSAQDESFGPASQGVGFERADISYDARSDRKRRFSTFTTAGSLAVPSSVVVERVDAFLASRQADRPLFLYVNFQDTHFPYHHRGIEPLISASIVGQADIAPQNVDAVRAMYLNTVANVDRAIGQILERTRRSLGREPGVIVLSDHGESLFDEDFLGHGYALNDAQTRIPLIAANLPITIEEPFGESDLRDAIARALELPTTTDPTPTLRDNPNHTVFQYLGEITRPAQVALTGSRSRIAYDFRERKVRIGTGEWRPPAELSGPDHEAFLGLVRLWERMMLARNSSASGDEDRGP